MSDTGTNDDSTLAYDTQSTVSSLTSIVLVGQAFTLAIMR